MAAMIKLASPRLSKYAVIDTVTRSVDGRIQKSMCEIDSFSIY